MDILLNPHPHFYLIYNSLAIKMYINWLIKVLFSSIRLPLPALLKKYSLFQLYIAKYKGCSDLIVG